MKREENNGKARILLDKIEEGAISNVVGKRVLDLLAKSTETKIVVPYISELDENQFDYENSFAKRNSHQIVCNLNSVGCNPYTVKKLIDLGVEVRTNSRIHAKVYITYQDEKAYHIVLSSGNFSENGLGTGNIDCGVEIKYENKPQKYYEWFQSIWNDSSPISNDMMKKAKSDWREKQYWGKVDKGEKPCFLDYLTNTPDDSTEIYFVLCQVNIDMKTDGNYVNEKLGFEPFDIWLEGDADNKNDVKIIEERKKSYLGKTILEIGYKTTRKNGNNFKELDSDPPLFCAIRKEPFINKEANEYCSLLDEVKTYKEFDFKKFLKKLNGCLKNNPKKVDDNDGVFTIEEMKKLLDLS